MRNKLQDDLREDAGKWLLETTEFQSWEKDDVAAGLRLEGEGKSIHQLQIPFKPPP
jgi:hypothetical protein